MSSFLQLIRKPSVVALVVIAFISGASLATYQFAEAERREDETYQAMIDSMQQNFGYHRTITAVER